MLYRATRIGKGGKTFTMFKFRTMVKNADTIGGSSTSENDPRITKIGSFLRKTKLDELPQILNILRGDMCLIGWRPESPEYLSTFDPLILTTKPGIIGLATVWDSDEGARLKDSSDPDKTYVEEILPTKRALELYYVKNRNIRLDLWILTQTIKKLLLRSDVQWSELYTKLKLPISDRISRL